MVENFNKQTQPQNKYRVFNNWDVVPLGWYFVCASSDLKTKQIKSFFIGNQKLVTFRDEGGNVHTLDSFCPHMGADLTNGRVLGENIQCFFHHWEYSGQGECIQIPCLDDVPEHIRTNGYATCERYGAIWCYPDLNPERKILEIPGLEGKEVIASVARKPNVSQSHHHISMINGIDPQHLVTIHKLSMDMELETKPDGNHVEFILTGPTPSKSLLEKVTKFLIGDKYSYAMKYADACLASLTLMRNVYFIKKTWKWPELYMFYAYRPGVDGKSYTFPIYIAEKKAGLKGLLSAHFKIWLTKRMYFFLKDDDDIIYDNIRFNPKNLLPMDSPVAKYITYVNKLKLSKWSKQDEL